MLEPQSEDNESATGIGQRSTCAEALTDLRGRAPACVDVGSRGPSRTERCESAVIPP